MIHKKNIYGTSELIHGSVLLTNVKTGKTKWFLVCEIEDTPTNRKNFNDVFFGKKNIRLTSDFRISQRQASQLPCANADGLTPYDGYKF